MTTPPQNPYGPGQDPWGTPHRGPQPSPGQPWGQQPSPGQPWGPPAQDRSPYGQPAWGAAPPPPPPRRNNPLVIVGALVAVLLVAGGLVFASTRGSDGPSVAAPTSTAVPPSNGAGGTSAPARTTTAPPSTGGSGSGQLSVDVAVGGCVAVSGSSSSPDLTPVDCGSRGSSYKVTATAATSDGCTADSDYVYYETSRFGSDELGALCMDVDWTEGQCFELGAGNPARADCTVPGTDVERVGPILRGTSDEQDCDKGGIPYAERSFVVCLTRVTAS
jgi:hypothetical protein